MLTDVQKRGQADALLLLLVGIALVGLVLLFVVLLMGRKVRQVTRADEASPTSPDAYEVLRAERRRKAAEADREQPLDDETSL